MNLIEIDGHLIDISKVERITPIQTTYIGANCYELAFTIHFHKSALTIYITNKKYYNTTYQHSEEELAVLTEKHKKIADFFKSFHGASNQPKEESCAVCGRPDVKVYDKGSHLCLDCSH